MKVIKNINNNVSLCIDSNGKELIAFGKGIGFIKPPYEIPLEKIQRTFYDIDSNYFSVISEMDVNIIDIAVDVVDYANKKFDGKFSNNVVLTLADHIQFAIQRKEEKIDIKLPLLYEVKLLYPKEIEVGYYALKIIKDKMNVILPDEEAACITLHLIDYKSKIVCESHEQLIEDCTKIIEKDMNIKIDRSSFTYSRFMTHMYYLIGLDDKNIHNNNHSLYTMMKKEYPDIYRCAKDVIDKLGYEEREDELVYLMMHINKLCSKN